MKKVLWILISIVLLTFVVVAQTTTSSKVVYISPNNDGVQDELVLPLNIKDKRYISEWKLVITDENQNVIKEIGNKHKRADTATDVFKNLFSGEGIKGFFQNLGKTFAPKQGVEVPAEVRWNGVLDSGELVKDGKYGYYFYASDDNGNKATTKVYELVVDNEDPEIALTQPAESAKIFGSDLKPSISFKQTGSVEDLWTATITDINGKVVKTFSWENSAPLSVQWDGNDETGAAVEEGVYTYQVSCTDKAGNTSANAVVSNIIYDAIPRSVNLAVQGSPFSPNNDGVRDVLIIEPTVPNTSGLTSWKVEVIDSNGKINRTISGQTEVPSSIEYDGKNDNKQKMLDGEYQIAFTAIFSNGQEPTISRNVVMDTIEPRASIKIETDVLSPDGDGNKDTITFVQTASSEKEWSAQILNSKAQVVKAWNFPGVPPESIVWDGISDDGNLCADDFYYYVLSATDAAGNKGEYKTENGFELDTQKTEIMIRTEYAAFSPNGDGSQDTISLTPIVKNTSGLDRYSLSVMDSTGNVVKMWADSKNLPSKFEWNGISDENYRCPDGNYSAILQTISKNGSEALAVTQPFAIDTVAPKVELYEIPYLVFSPNSDGLKDVIKVNLNTSSEDLWLATIKNSSGKSVKDYSWQGKASSFEWNGTDNNGNIVQDGKYSLEISCKDAAGNKTVLSEKNLVMDTRATKAYITAEAEAFSPNGDKVKDTQKFSLMASPTDGLKTWKVSVLDSKAKTIMSWSSENQKDMPKMIEWNGVGQDNKVTEGSFIAKLDLEYEKGDVISVSTSQFVCSVTAPVLTVQTSPKYFSPDNDGLDDDLFIKLKGESNVPFASWSFEIKDAQGSKSFWKTSGKSAITERLIWDGRSNSGELVQSATDYPYTFIVTDTLGMTSVVEGNIAVDVLVIRIGDVLKMQVPSIIFRSNNADFVGKDKDPQSGLNKSVIANNERVLKRIAEILNKFKEYNVIIEGHANNISGTEEEETIDSPSTYGPALVPLSEKRAQYVKERLTGFGVNGARLSTVGVGGRQPVAPQNDKNVSWKNRRVEFILQK